MKKAFLIIVVLFVQSCSLQAPYFSVDISTLPEGKEIRMKGILEKNLSKTGSAEYSIDGIWITFDDDFPTEILLNKKVMVTGRVHHFNNCPKVQDPEYPEQCRISDQLQVQHIEAE